jgi:hypothetical protein
MWKTEEKCKMLTREQKQNLVDAMMTQVEKIEEPHVIKEMAECAWHDLKLITPALEDMLAQAEARGRFAGILEMIGNRHQNGEESADVVMHTHGCVVCKEPVSCSCPFPDEPTEVYCQADFPF